MGTDDADNKIGGDLEKEVQDRLNKAEYALQLLADRAHPRIEKLLNGITSHYRVVTHRETLERVHAGCQHPHEELLANSEAAGTIRSSFVKGEIEIEVYSVDLNQAELLSRSKGELVSLIFDAIGLTRPGNAMIPLPFEIVTPPDKKK